jgi:integrase
MKRIATPGNKTGSSSSSRRYRYTKVLDNRKHPIRGLWRRNGSFVARISVENEAGRKDVRWVPVAAMSAAEAQEEFRKLLVERSENRLRHIGRAPAFGEFYDQTYLPMLQASGKKPGTIITEKTHYKRWQKALGHLRLDKIRPSHIQDALNKLRAVRSPRTCNVALVCLRHVLKAAKRDGYLKTLPTEDISWQRTEQKSRRLFTREDVDLFCQAALTATKNGAEFTDYFRLLALCGAREQETIKLRWADVDFEHKLLTIGADADTKNREARRVDFNAELETHLKAMHTRRAPDSKWLFPSPQRGDEDNRAKTFRESLLLTRAVAGWICRDCKQIKFGKETPKTCPQCQSTRLEHKEKVLPDHLQKFGFHDCRHHFISYAVMSGIDFMTIARWVGHKDGGILIGKVYGHLSNEHAQLQAARMNFGPAIVTMPQVATV